MHCCVITGSVDVTRHPSFHHRLHTAAILPGKFYIVNVKRPAGGLALSYVPAQAASSEQKIPLCLPVLLIRLEFVR